MIPRHCIALIVRVSPHSEQSTVFSFGDGQDEHNVSGNVFFIIDERSESIALFCCASSEASLFFAIVIRIALDAVNRELFIHGLV